MKRTFVVMLILGGVITSYAQVPTRMFEKNKAFEIHPNFQISRTNAPEKKMPVFDVAPLLEEDQAVEGMDYPFRFGKSFDVNLSLKDGKWVKTDSTEVWSLKIISPGAYSLNFIFSDLYLPKGAKLYIFNEDGSMVYGPVTDTQNQHGKTYLTDIIQGDAVTIRLSVQNTAREKPRLTIQNVVHGYRNLFSNNNLESYGESGDCVKDEDIVCYPAWSEESDGVVQILLANGSELCSGSLLNNTAQDYRPFILTAFHCIDVGSGAAYQNGVLDQNEINQAEDWLVRFRFRHTTCRGSTIDNVITYDDTHFRAAWHPTDFALVELQDNIVNDIYSVGQKVWLGWDRTGNTPSTATCIHHPAGDVMKYTYDGESPTVTNYGGTNNSHWLVDDWDIGNTEGGSSGSPLFDQNKRVIGQDHAGDGEPTCDEDKGTYFGRLSLSWTGGGTNATRLSNWLEPSGSATTLNSVRQPTPEYSGIGNLLCSSSYFSVTNLAPGYSVDHWNGSNVTFPNGDSGNPVLVSPSSQGEAWVQAVINTGGGQYTMSQRHFWSGAPRLHWVDPDDVTHYGSGSWQYCLDEITADNYLTLRVDNSNLMDESYSWHFYDPDVVDVIADNQVLFRANKLGYSNFYCRATNTCGTSGPFFFIMSVDDCLKLLITPNPSTGETTVTIESSSAKSLEMNAEWDLEVYNQGQQLKAKKSKIKGKTTTLNTSSWQEGVYVVRANYKGEVATEKLVVKKQ